RSLARSPSGRPPAGPQLLAVEHHLDRALDQGQGGPHLLSTSRPPGERHQLVVPLPAGPGAHHVPHREERDLAPHVYLSSIQKVCPSPGTPPCLPSSGEGIQTLSSSATTRTLTFTSGMTLKVRIPGGVTPKSRMSNVCCPSATSRPPSSLSRKVSCTDWVWPWAVTLMAAR